MTDTDVRRDLVIGIDPARHGHLALAWAADEAHRRGLVLRLVVAVPPVREWRGGDDRPGREAVLQAGVDTLRESRLGPGHSAWADLPSGRSLTALSTLPLSGSGAVIRASTSLPRRRPRTR